MNSVKIGTYQASGSMRIFGKRVRVFILQDSTQVLDISCLDAIFGEFDVWAGLNHPTVAPHVDWMVLNSSQARLREKGGAVVKGITQPGIHHIVSAFCMASTETGHFWEGLVPMSALETAVVQHVPEPLVAAFRRCNQLQRELASLAGGGLANPDIIQSV